MERSDTLVELKDIVVSFGKKEKKKTVLNGITFTIGRGEIVGLAGESGSGKSTIAKAILGMVPVESGNITLNTKAPQMVFQDPYSSLNPAKTIGWIMQEPLKLAPNRDPEAKVPDADTRRSKVAEMLREVGLDESYMVHKPRELSGGQRQRICIGTALMTEPELLIADEPVSALDVTIQAQVLALMKELHEKKNLAMLFISHDLRTMYHFCDRILILNKGRIVEEGAPDTLYRDPKEEYTKLLLKSAGISKT